MEKVSNHYVPQFYLKNFSNNKKSIGMYNINHRKYIKEASIKKQACKDYLYGDDGTLEDWLQEIETDCSPIFKSIINSSMLPSEGSGEYELLLFFILLSEARSLKSAESMNSLVDSIASHMLKIDQSHGFSKEEIDKYKISLNIPNAYSIEATRSIYPILFDLKMVLLLTKNDRKFITSDNPLVRYNQMYIQRQYALRGYGFANMGIQLFFPISPEACICIFDDAMYQYTANQQGNIELKKGKQVDEINRLIYLNSYESIYFNNIVKEPYIRRIAESSEHFRSDINKEISILGDDKNKIFGFSQNRVTERINLSFFKIRPELLKISLPPHMGGPVRPYARQFVEK